MKCNTYSETRTSVTLTLLAVIPLPIADPPTLTPRSPHTFSVCIFYSFLSHPYKPYDSTIYLSFDQIVNMNKSNKLNDADDVERGTPLLVPRPADYRPEDDDEELKEIPNWTWKERVVTALAGSTSLLSLLSMFTLPNPLVYLSSIMGIILPPYSAFLERKITECIALEETNQAMDRELNNLHYENERLDREVKKLQTSVSHLQEMEYALKQLRSMEHVSYMELQQQLNESQQILNQLEVGIHV